MSRRHGPAQRPSLPGPRPRRGPGPSQATPPRPLDDAEIATLAAALAALPAPLEPLDISALDGFLCGMLVQPVPIAKARWLPLVLDTEGRPPPAGSDLTALIGLIERRAGELRDAIERRIWFDPWVFPEDDESHDGEAGDDATGPDAVPALAAPWVVGLAAALDAFPALLDDEGPELDEALAPAFRFLDRADLEDAEGLFAVIDELGPAASLEAAVEGLVRSTLLLADVAGLPERKPAPR